jgi:hypothetical protein
MRYRGCVTDVSCPVTTWLNLTEACILITAAGISPLHTISDNSATDSQTCKTGRTLL